MVGGAFREFLRLHLTRSQQHLPASRQFHIMRRMQVFQNLLRDALEHGRRNLSTLMEADSGIENDRHHNRGIVQWGKPGE